MLDSGSYVENVVGPATGRFVRQALVRPTAVMVPGVLGKDFTQMPLAEDQHVVQAVTAQRARDSSANAFIRGDWTAERTTLAPAAWKTASKEAPAHYVLRRPCRRAAGVGERPAVPGGGR